MKVTNRGLGRISIPMVTPFGKDEAIDTKVYKELIDYVITHDMGDSVIATGTTGEAASLMFEERVELFKAAKEAVANRCKLMCGTGCASTKETLELTKKAVELGTDFCLIVAPFYSKPDQEGLYNHYMRLADETDAKIMLYNIPIFTGVNLDPKTVARLAKHENIFGIKDEAGINPNQVLDYRLHTIDIDPDFIIFNGDYVMLLPTIAQGAQGIISGSAHIIGDILNSVFDAFELGDNAGALAAFTKIFRFCQSWGRFGRIHPNPVLRPAIEKVTGLRIGPARGPLAPMRPEEEQYLDLMLKELGKV